MLLYRVSSGAIASDQISDGRQGKDEAKIDKLHSATAFVPQAPKSNILFQRLTRSFFLTSHQFRRDGAVYIVADRETVGGKCGNTSHHQAEIELQPNKAVSKSQVK
jgi:hypothetical protein